MPAPRVVKHPLVEHQLAILRRQETPPLEFRRTLSELGKLLVFEVTSSLPTREVEVETPLETCRARELEPGQVCLVSVLRAGNGLLDPFLEMIPGARVGHLGIYRDPETLEAVPYYRKLPPDLERSDVFVLDPMLATGNSAALALDEIAREKPRSLHLVGLLAAPEALEHLARTHPSVPVTVAALDERLDEKGYIRPGLGDAGDRIYDTSSA